MTGESRSETKAPLGTRVWVPRSAISDGHLEPVHTALPERAHLDLTAPFELFRIITFLNRTLKHDGFVFGLTQSGDQAAITVYDTRQAAGDRAEANAPDARETQKEPVGQGSGTGNPTT